MVKGWGGGQNSETKCNLKSHDLMSWGCSIGGFGKYKEQKSGSIKGKEIG